MRKQKEKKREKRKIKKREGGESERGREKVRKVVHERAVDGIIL